MAYFVNILVLVNLYVILATSFNLLLGYAGLFSIAHSAFYGLGAYTSALAAAHLGLPLAVAIAVGVAFAALIGVALAIPTLRVSGDYLVIATLGFQVIVVRILLNLEITGGPGGLTGIRRITWFGQPFTAPGYVLFTGLVALAVLLLSRWVVRSPFGRVLKGIREDAVATAALGKHVNGFKVTAFAIASGLAALAGGLYGHYFQYVNPYDYQINESVLVLSMVVVGGMGTVWGPALGALLLVALPEALRFVSLPTSVAAPLRQIIYAVLVLAFLYLRPEGILGRRGGEVTTAASAGRESL